MYRLVVFIVKCGSNVFARRVWQEYVGIFEVQQNLNN
jgi:hypothetical protein